MTMRIRQSPFSPDWRAGGAQQAVYANRCYVTYSIPTFRPSVIPQLAHFEYERVWKVMHRISGATSACDSSMAERSIYLDRRF